MAKKPALRPGEAVDDALRATACDILAEARAALEAPKRGDAIAVHDFRKAMKRWRAFLWLLDPILGEDTRRLQIEARDLARALAGARDAQSALDALVDLGEGEVPLPPASLATIISRLEPMRQAAEAATQTAAMRSRLMMALASLGEAIAHWPFDRIGFSEISGRLTDTYRQARRAAPCVWEAADGKALHELRKCVIDHRYQMELVEPLWPKLGRLWVDEAQRLRDRLGAYQNLAVLATLTAPHQPLARWRARLSAPVAARQAKHVAATARLAGRLFAESPKAFRRRLEALWQARSLSDE